MSDALESAHAALISELGYDARAEHLKDSPARVARFLREWHTEGKPPPVLTTFKNADPRMDELVCVGGIEFHSLCAHHGLPFYGRAAIGYIPGDTVLGLSKFARVVQHFAQRFQVQEVLTQQIVDYLQAALNPIAIGAVLRASHMCMSMRGVRARGAVTTTSVMRGAFRDSSHDSAAARAELLALTTQGDI